MNVIFLTQSRTLPVFHGAACAMRERISLDRVGFYVADSVCFESVCAGEPDLASGRYEFLKEWEVLKKAASLVPDLARLSEHESRLGDPVLWNALVADRRIYLGRRATIEQDYPSRFSHERMLAILQAGVEEMESFFDRVKPDLVVGFICVTIGDYLGYLIAKARGIPVVNLRPTRIKNYFYGGEDIFDPSARLEKAYRGLLAAGLPENGRREVESYLAEVRRTHAMYEGVIPASGPIREPAEPGSHGLLGRLTALARMSLDSARGRYRFDTHQDQGVLYPLWFKHAQQPLRAWRTQLALGGHYVREGQLAGMDYAFFPLHKEPEVTLLVYSRPHLNQIEAVRNLARSLPVGMKLLVKEHPAAVGYHPLAYYRKLLDIPNVRLAPPEMSSRKLVENAKLVAVISGSVGLEALIMRKPVVVLGGAPFAFLPGSMVRWVRDADRLATEIAGLLKSHRHDEEALAAYLAAVMQSSVPIDFYSRLIGRRGGYVPGSAKPEDPQEHVRRLADYIASFAAGAAHG